MRLAIVSNSYWQVFPYAPNSAPGSEACVVTFCEELAKHDHDFFVVCPQRSAGIRQELPFEIVETSALPESVDMATEFASDASKILADRKNDYDIILSVSNWSSRFCYDTGKPQIISYHDGMKEKPKGFLPSDDAYFGRLFFNRFISKYQASVLCATEKETRNSFVCYTGLPDNEFELYENKTKTFIWCGSLYYGFYNAKGLPEFLIMAKRHPESNFAAYGVGPENLIARIKDQTRQMDNFIWGGSLNKTTRK